MVFFFKFLFIHIFLFGLLMFFFYYVTAVYILTLGLTNRSQILSRLAFTFWLFPAAVLLDHGRSTLQSSSNGMQTENKSMPEIQNKNFEILQLSISAAIRKLTFGLILQVIIVTARCTGPVATSELWEQVEWLDYESQG